jgi:dTDP-4-dehydrorhamnose reductase
METDTGSAHCKPELWAGLECTINRVGNKFRDQLEYAGFYDRKTDLELVLSLPIKALRYPILWEKHQSLLCQPIDWTRSTQQLSQIIKTGVTPIVGLLHHGSGPGFTCLSDPAFPKLFARYAQRVAKRFPFLDHYTPVNEPLTTARFSGLYGTWYPHKTDALSFLKILLNEIKGTVLAMKAIREINPQAKLVQTEDLAKTHSTIKLKYQADFENERRWLSFDLLMGKVNCQHPMWSYLRWAGISDREILFFQENPMPPDVMGLNYYVVSERFLDQDIKKYPHVSPGGNGRDEYVDVDAVRVGKYNGLGVLLREAWDRFHSPMAITEAHISCTREEQMRWFAEIWETCCDARQNGIPVKAVTAWSLLGAFDWNSLLVDDNRQYEPGVFDLRHGKVHSNALTGLVKSIGEGKSYDHPLLRVAGWWKGEEANPKGTAVKQPLVIFGKNGTLAQAIARLCHTRRIPCIALSRQDGNVSDPDGIAKTLNSLNPWAIINASGFVDVDRAETQRTLCYQVNTKGPANLARECNRRGIKFVTFSSDLVFDGQKSKPYTENDIPNALNYYGITKMEAESMVSSICPDALIIRASAFFGPWDQFNFASLLLNSLSNAIPFTAVSDVTVSPTYVPDLVNAALDLLVDEKKGIWHVTNGGALSWAEFGRWLAERGGYKATGIQQKSIREMNWSAPRPKYSALECNRRLVMPALESAIDRYFTEKELTTC